MSKVCGTCGASLHEGAKFCKNCGASTALPAPPAVVIPGFSCPACGAHNPFGATHCQSCGRPLPRTAATYSTAGTCPSCGASNAPENPQCMACGRPLPNVYLSTETPVRRRSHSKPLILSATAAILAVAMVLGLWKPGYLWRLMEESPLPSLSGIGEKVIPGVAGQSQSVVAQSATALKPDIKITDKDIKKAKAETDTVSPNTPAVEIGDVSVDFGEYNLLNEETLEVRKLAAKTDKKLGCTAQPYDFSLGGGQITEFANLVDITLPYEECSNPEDRIMVQYYNDKIGEWKYLPYTINTAGHTVTFETDHFSTFAVFDMYEFDIGYTGPLTEARFTPAKLEKMCSDMNSDLFYSMLQANQIPLAESADVMLGTANNLTSGVDHAISGHSALTGFTSQTAELMNKRLGYLGIALVVLKVGAGWYNTGNLSDTVSKNAYDLAEMAAGIGAMTVGGVFFSVAAAGIWANGLVDSTMRDLLNSGYEDSVEKAYNRFSEQCVTYINAENRCSFKLKVTDLRSANVYWQESEFPLGSESEWNVALKCIYNKYKQDPAKINQAVVKLVEDYASVFWRIPEKTRQQYIQDAALTDFKMPDEAAQQRYTRRLKGRLLAKLEPLFNKYYKLAMHDARIAAINTAMDIQDYLNQLVLFKIDVGDKTTFDKSSYKDYVIMFDNSNSELFDYWLCYTDKNSNEVFRCTLFCYLLAGSPTKLKFYKTEKDFRGTAPPEFELEFKTELPVTTIPLSDDLKFEDILGNWDMTVTVDGFKSDYMDQLVGQMEGVSGMEDYLSQYKQAMGGMDGAHTGTMVISRAAPAGDIADIKLVYPGYDYGGVMYRGTWEKGGTLYLKPAGEILGGSWTLTFKKDGQKLNCQGTSTYESNMASYSYTITATKQQ